MVGRLYHRVLMALRSFLRRRTVEQELDEELQFHLDQMQEFALSRGDDPSDARWRARRHLGSVDYVKEACRDMRTLRPVEEFLHDLRFGARLLARGRGFAVVAVVSLALGIGASSSIFSLINVLVLRPLPIADPHELYIAQVTEPHEVDLLFSSSVVDRTSKLLAGRAEIAAQSSTESVLIATRGHASPPEAARLQLVADDFFGTLRQRAQIGRLLGPGDNRTVGQHPVAVISDQYWSRRFGRTARVLDTELIINGAPMAIVGVAAPEFFGATVDSQTPDVWAPAAMQAALRFAGNLERTGGDLQKPWPSQPEFAWLQVMIRVRAGGAPAAAEAMTLARQPENAPVDGQDSRSAPVTLLPASGGLSPIRSELTTPLIVLLLMVGLLLAIACANIASLLLARATSRGREMAIRLSMGARRGRLIRQLLTESLLLASVGGVLGLALAYWGSTALLMLLTHGVPVSSIDVRPDWRVVSLTFATSIGTALAFGLLPAVRGTRLPLAETLKAQARSVIGTDRQGGRVPVGKVLIAGQMAFAILLLLVAALFARSLQALTYVDVGYDRDHLLVARVDPRSAGYDVTEMLALDTRVVERLTSLPGVLAVSMSANGPFSGSRSRGDFQAEGYRPSPNEQMIKHSEWVTSDYFRTVGLTIKQGRGFGPEDSAESRRVSVINETMAQRYFPGQNPIGRRWGNSSNFAVNGVEIVGVVEDARYGDVKAESLSMSYIPAVQSERYLRSIEVRTSSNPTALASAVRHALRESEPRLAIGAIDTLNERVVRSIRVERLLGWLTMTFGAAALSLACLGLYGTISYAVRRRTAELGIRMALGADRAAVQWLIVREALVLVLLGGAIGLPLAFLAARAVGSLLYATAPSDPIAYGTAVAVLVVVSAFAAYIPAWRASRLNPMTALRTE
jgi:predicted permease